MIRYARTLQPTTVYRYIYTRYSIYLMQRGRAESRYMLREERPIEPIPKIYDTAQVRYAYQAHSTLDCTRGAQYPLGFSVSCKSSADDDFAPLELEPELQSLLSPAGAPAPPFVPLIPPEVAPPLFSAGGASLASAASMEVGTGSFLASLLSPEEHDNLCHHYERGGSTKNSEETSEKAITRRQPQRDVFAFTHFLCLRQCQRASGADIGENARHVPYVHGVQSWIALEIVK